MKKLREDIAAIRSAIENKEAHLALDRIAAFIGSQDTKYYFGDRVTKIKGSKWTGNVVGYYTTDLTPVGYAVESATEKGSVQIYPEAALMEAPSPEPYPMPMFQCTCRYCKAGSPDYCVKAGYDG